jgi:hypothetical protein
MSELKKITVVFVHGYSVTNLNTYGELPLRMKQEGIKNKLDIDVEEIYLGQYISFHDEVLLDDISRAFESAVNEQLSDLIKAKKRFICITHSTGGPVIRNWWSKYYLNSKVTCPMSHLVMLAPANYGSTLAQLGKGRISRLKSWMEGVEPGQGVLDWLELGSTGSWELNTEWILQGEKNISPDGIFPFVIIGQSIDRKFYDNLNSYTGELGTDGVIRSAAANINSQYIKLEQGTKAADLGKLFLADFRTSSATAFRIVHNKSHSGSDMGIMGSVKKEITDKKSAETVKAIFDCIKVSNRVEYDLQAKKFIDETKQVQTDELVENFDGKLFNRKFIHNRYSQLIFKITDTEGNSVTDFDLLFTGPDDDPNHLPEGFFMDRQMNRVNRNTVTYYFNYDVMSGEDITGKAVNPGKAQANTLGLEIRPRPSDGFVRYLPCKLEATVDYLEKVLQPNTTTLLDIVLQRIVDKEVFRLKKNDGNAMPSTKLGDFSKIKPGKDFVE